MKQKNQTINHKSNFQMFFKSNTLCFVVAVFTMVILSVYNLVVSWLMQVIIDIVAGESTINLRTVVVIAAVTFVIFLIAYYIYRYARPEFFRKAMTQYKEHIFERLMQKNLQALYREDSGKYISALTNDMKSVEDNYLGSIFTIVDLSVGFIGAFILMLWYSPVLTIATIAFSMLPMIVSLPFAEKLAEKEKQVSLENANFVGVVKDVLNGFSVIKGFRAEKQMEKLFSGKNNQLETAKYERKTMEETIDLVSTSAGVIMRMGVFLFGAWIASSNSSITPGIVLVFLQLINFIIAPIEMFPQLLANRKAAKGLMDKMDTALSENRKTSDGVRIHRINTGITTQNLSFSFENDTPIINDLNLEFQTGKKYAIVGGSGSGKTTLLNALLGSFEHYIGNVYYDDKELRTIQTESLFDLVTLVQQNVFVFNDTIKNNITMFQKVDDDVLGAIYEKAGLQEVIKEKGSDYICGENGSALSGGERQRIAIARAMLRGTSVILLDEATSSLDNQTACDITNAILHTENLTGIVVTHRLEENLLCQYDKIYVLQSGRVAESGDFKELMDKKAVFYSLFTAAQV
jgi:ABC-type multidrug transport system fused ATPase/permease subunit